MKSGLWKIRIFFNLLKSRMRGVGVLIVSWKFNSFVGPRPFMPDNEEVGLGRKRRINVSYVGGLARRRVIKEYYQHGRGCEWR